MIHNVILDGDGYITAASSTHYIGDEQLKVDLPDNVDPEVMRYYRVREGKATLDEQKRNEERDIIDRKNRLMHRRQEATARLQEIQAESVAQSAATADDVIIIAPLLPEWDGRAYAEGSIVQFDGIPYRAIRDIAANPTWNPIAAPSEWAAFHATSREHALPWLQPTSAHDMYKRGEWMIWTDGATYECLQDTAYSPADQPQAWRRDSPDADDVDPNEPGEPDEPIDNIPDWKPWDNRNESLYQIGDIVRHNGQTWQATAGNNHWEPGVYGWERV